MVPALPSRSESSTSKIAAVRPNGSTRGLGRRPSEPAPPATRWARERPPEQLGSRLRGRRLGLRLGHGLGANCLTLAASAANGLWVRLLACPGGRSDPCRRAGAARCIGACGRRDLPDLQDHGAHRGRDGPGGEGARCGEALAPFRPRRNALGGGRGRGALGHGPGFGALGARRANRPGLLLLRLPLRLPVRGRPGDVDHRGHELGGGAFFSTWAVGSVPRQMWCP